MPFFPSLASAIALSSVPKVKTMPTRFPNRPSAVRRPPSHRRESAHANPLYGYGYNPAWPSILSVAIAMGVGVLFGVYPASRAARLAPIDALRSE